MAWMKIFLRYIKLLNNLWVESVIVTNKIIVKIRLCFICGELGDTKNKNLQNMSMANYDNDDDCHHRNFFNNNHWRYYKMVS